MFPGNGMDFAWKYELCVVAVPENALYQPKNAVIKPKTPPTLVTVATRSNSPAAKNTKVMNKQTNKALNATVDFMVKSTNIKVKMAQPTKKIQ